MPFRDQLPHLLIPTSRERVDFTPIGRPIDMPPLTARQQRYLHATKLNNDVDQAVQARLDLLRTMRIPDTEVAEGICLEIEGSESIPLNTDQLENRQSKKNPVELLNVRVDEGTLKATIFVPNNRRLDSVIRNKIARYGDESKDVEGTKGSTIAVDSIEAIKLADLSSFWMESTPLPSDTAQSYTWEVWLRKGAADVLRSRQQHLNVKVSNHSIKFQETEICLLTCSLETLATLQLLAAPLASFRYREQAPGFFDGLTPSEQADWVANLQMRLEPTSGNVPAVCVLDTGVRRTHPLLTSSLSENDCDSYEPEWGEDDHHGHGTEIAGLALFGDLTPLLSNNEPIALKHRLESVKILPVSGSNPEELYGWITQEAAARAKVNARERQRVFCLAVTSAGHTNGKPTAWSATIDKLSMGTSVGNETIEDEAKKLFVISAGNIRDELQHSQYPQRNDLEPIENPSQAWNALTVGGITHKMFSEDRALDGWSVLSPVGEISPTSRTSVAWEEKDWPIKPDIVFEGGNCISDGQYVSHDADLSVLSTGRNIPLIYTCETSAATAQAAQMAAILHAEYPNLWPETVRGLLAHSARWHENMYRGQRLENFNAADKANLLRRFGYGQPSLELARYSASNRACMVVQADIQPFSRDEGEQNASYMDMNIHTLPWPVDVLRENGFAKVSARVTLSFFIEPNPADRLPTQKYSYASHRLRFELQRANESIPALRQRLNQQDRNRSNDYQRAQHSSNNWVLSSQARNKGSLISDEWKGTAAELAEQSTILVIPEGGWWKYRKHLNRTNQRARYALIVSLETENQELDIYTPIYNQISSMIEV